MAIVKEYEMKVNTADAQENVEDLNKEIKETGTDISGVEAAADKATGGMVSGFKGAVKGVKSFIGGLKTMRGALIATGLGAFVIAVGSLAAAFTSSEEGQNKFAKIMGVIGSVTGNLITMLSDLGFKIIEVFENPKQALIDFKDAFVKNITNRISSAIETIGFLGSAIKKVFSGDFTGALDDAKSAGSSYVDSLTGVKNTLDKVSTSVSNLTTELIEEGKVAGKIADQRAQADKLDRKLTVERAKANRDRAAALESAVNKEKFSVEERIAFLQEAGRIEEEITEKELVSARLRLEAKISENALANSTKEDLEEEANLRANLINLETAKLAKQKEVTSQTIALKAEEAAELKAIEDKKKTDQEQLDAEELEAEKTLADLKKQIRDASAVQEDDIRNLEIIKVKEHYDNLINLAKEQGLDVAALEKAKADKLNSFNEQNAKDEIYWETLTQDQKTKIVSDGLNNLASILGEETAAGKAAAIASATINTFQSAQASYKSLAGIPVIGPALGVAASGAAIVSGFKQVQAIRATKLPTLAGQPSPDVGGGGTPSPQAAQVPQIPSFNIVGQTGTNQLADALSTQEQKPVKAFVVASDVTTGQSLERNIIEGASL